MHTCDIEPGQAEEPMTFRKMDTGRSRLDLIPPHAWEEVGHVFSFGAIKHGEEDNWRLCENPKRFYLAAALRHVMKILMGEVLDPESGRLHAAHAVADLLIYMELKRIAGE